jgi:hypothetical protein
MKTRRLRTMQQPSPIEKLLEALVSRANLLPQDSYQIRDPGALPPPLQTLVAQAAEQGRVWRCWSNSYATCLFICEMSLHRSRERASPVLLVNRYSESGELQDAGSWMSDQEGKWRPCAD